MKKIILFVLVFFTIGMIEQSYASTSYTSTSGIKECEGQSRNNNSGQKYIPVTNKNSASTPGSFSCEKHGYRDGSRSGRKSKNTIYNCPDDKYASKIKRSGSSYSVYCKKRDDTAPSLSDVTNNNYSNLLADNSKSYYISINRNSGSPIDYIKYKKEKYNTTNSLSSEITDSSSPWGENSWNISKVDNDRETNGSRIYKFQLKKICDEAGNCWNGTKNYNHNIYANSNDLGTFEFTNSTVSNFTSWKTADGTSYPLIAILKDTHGNILIPATGIHRTIDFNFNTNNNLNKDQYSNNGNAVYLTIPSDSSSYENRIGLGNNKNTHFNSQPSNTGNYTFNWRIYAPTNTSNDPDNHDFMIKKVTFDINQSDSNPNIDNITSKELLNSRNIDFNFKSLYKTEFSGEQEDNGFIEGVTQTGGKLTIHKETYKTTKNRYIYLIKSGSAKDSFIGTGVLDSEDITSSDAKLIKKIKYYSFYSFTRNTTDQDPNFTTLFTLDPNATTIKDIKDLYVNSWIYYKIKINGTYEKILYAGDKVGGDKGQINAGLKIYGISNISNKKIRNITENQDSKSIHNLNGHITKATLKNKIRSKAYKIIKDLDKSNNTDVNYGEEEEIGDKFIYYDLRNDLDKLLTIKINDLNNINKTIIIYGGNLYLKCDGTNVCGTDGSNFPGIIVMKDELGKGGKLYIDPNVNRIDAAIYVDKSILSYNNTFGEISPNNGGTYDILKNQLYINGSIFSENTIGGSRIGSSNGGPLCPFYLGYPNNKCNGGLDEAQKYDLNYLRRGIENKSNSSLDDYPVIIKYNTKLQLNPPTGFKK